MDMLRELGLPGLLVRCSPHVDEELRECIGEAMLDSPLVSGIERRCNRIDFTTIATAKSSFETAILDRYSPNEKSE